MSCFSRFPIRPSRSMLSMACIRHIPQHRLYSGVQMKSSKSSLSGPKSIRRKRPPILLGPQLNLTLNDSDFSKKTKMDGKFPLRNIGSGRSKVVTNNPQPLIKSLELPDVPGFMAALASKDLNAAIIKLESIAFSQEVETISLEQCKALLRLLSSQERPDRDALDLIKRLVRKRGFEDSTSIYNYLLKIYSKWNDMYGMQATLAEMRRKGINETVETYNRILAIFPRSEFSSMLELFGTMVDNGIQPNLETIHLLFLRCDKSHIQWAIDYFEQHKVELFKSDAIMNEVIGMYAFSDKLSEAESLLAELKSSNRLSVPIATSMMNAYVACGEFQKAIHLMEDLQSAQVKLDGLSYLPYFRALQHLDRVSEIPGILNQLRSKGFTFTASFFNYIFKVADEQNWTDLALSLASDCFKAQISLNSASFEPLLALCIRHNLAQDAVVLVEHILLMKRASFPVLIQCMTVATNTQDRNLLRRIWIQLTKSSKSSTVDADLYVGMAECCIKVSDFDEALNYFDSALKQQASASPGPIASFIVTAAQSRRYDLALKALKLLRDQSAENMEHVSQVIQQHSREFERVLYELCKQSTTIQSLSLSLENRRVALALYKQLLLTNSNISEKTYQIIMEAYRGEQDLVGVVRVWSSLVSQYQKPSPESTHILLSACLSLGKAKTYHAIFALLKKQQLDMSPACYRDLILLGIKHGSEKHVLDLLFEMHAKSVSIALSLYKRIRVDYGKKGIPLAVQSFFEENYPDILEAYEIDLEEQRQFAQSLIPQKL